MKYAVVYSSRTGNTKLLAETVRDTLPADGCVYFGSPDEKALTADRIYVGFWTDKGTCDEETAGFLKKLTDQEVYLFGTAGFGVSQEYFDKVLSRAEKNLSKEVSLVGTFMCQGKMPMSVRQRYEKMMNGPSGSFNIQGLIDNFDRALSHPDARDLENLKKAVCL